MALAGAALVVVLTLTVLPYLASTRIVSDRIAVEVSSWSGYRVELGAPPTIEFWPRFRAVLTDVSLSEWGAGEHAAIATAERVDIMLSAFAAMRGDAVFTSISVTRPELRVHQGPDGIMLPVRPGGGRINSAIDAARRAVRANPENPDTTTLPNGAFGSVRIADGRIVVASDGGSTELVTDMFGTFDWAELNGSGGLSAKGRWRGEDIAIDIQSSSPLLLFAGGTTAVSADVKAAAGEATFTGTAKLTDDRYFDGMATFNAPSFARLARWAGARVPAETAIGAASLSSSISGNGQNIKFNQASLEIDGNRGTGAIELSFSGTTPKVSGSLAFETLDIPTVLGAFAPLTGMGEQPAAAREESLRTPALNIDLRFSATRAKAGAINLSNVAATAQIKDALSVFDISDATAFGGTVQAGLRFDRGHAGQTVEMRLLASDIEGGAFGVAAGMTRLVPIGRGTVSVILKGRGDDLPSMLKNADGSVTATFGAGALTGFDLGGFLQRAKSGGFFSLDEVSNGSLQIDGMDLQATIQKGVARIERAVARAGGKDIKLEGIVPYVGRGLALTGTVATSNDATGKDKANFFVGGSWDAPFVSPTLTDPPLQ